MTESSSPRLLTADLLAELDQRLRDIGAPVTRIWRPGLSDNDMDELTGPIDLTLPIEARAWWAWHDGVERGVVRPQPAIGTGWVPLPLAEAVRQVTFYRETSAVEVDADGYIDRRGNWSTSWIALCGNPSPERLACECAVPAGAPSPAIYFDPEGEDEPQRPKAPSIGEVIHAWIEALDDGTWHIDPATGNFALTDPMELLHVKGADVADLL
jgi:cell wall assembly regulator SMI1